MKQNHEHRSWTLITVEINVSSTSSKLSLIRAGMVLDHFQREQGSAQLLVDKEQRN